jgi:hypothetical protein
MIYLMLSIKNNEPKEKAPASGPEMRKHPIKKFVICYLSEQISS